MHKTIGYASIGLALYFVVRGFFAKLAAKIGFPFVTQP